MPKITSEKYRFDGSRKFDISKSQTKLKDIYTSTEEYDQLIAESAKDLDELQSKMYAHNRYGLLVIFQAMDAAGKDGTIKHVLSGVNPAGVKIHNFKRPTDEELNHDFLWRSNKVLPERGNITIFNRSYYEEVIVVKIDKSIIKNVQLIPEELTSDWNKIWKHRHKDIRHMEKYLYRNGIRVIKFFLNVSKQEQADRLIERIKDPSKNWKFEEQDVKIRDQWNEYMNAYEDCINETATAHAPWYVIPADDKKNMRLIVGQVIEDELKKMNTNYPVTSAERAAELNHFIEIIEQQNKT